MQQQTKPSFPFLEVQKLCLSSYKQVIVYMPNTALQVTYMTYDQGAAIS